MRRINQDDVQRSVDRMNAFIKPDVPYRVEYAYGQPRVIQSDGRGYINISPRLSKPQLVDWIYTYLSGYELALRKFKPEE